MFLPVNQKIDWEELITRKQQIICKNNKRENSKRIDHNFKKGDCTTLVRPGVVERTLVIKRKGPYKVVKQHKNGSIIIQVTPYEAENINKHRLIPHYRLSDGNPTNNDNK